MKAKFNSTLYPKLSIIKDETEKITGIEDISCKSRTRQNVMARWIYIKAAREFTEHSMMAIASAIERDHATVVHALSNMEFDFTYDKDLQTQYDELAIILTNKLQINALEEIEQRIDELQDRLHILRKRRQILINNEFADTELEDKKDEQVFWS